MDYKKAIMTFFLLQAVSAWHQFAIKMSVSSNFDLHSSVAFLFLIAQLSGVLVRTDTVVKFWTCRGVPGLRLNLVSIRCHIIDHLSIK